MTKIAVIDYGMGNLHSVSKALEAVSTNEEVLVTSEPELIKTADKIVLPGVGAIKDCLEAFSDELRRTTIELISNKPTSEEMFSKAKFWIDSNADFKQPWDQKNYRFPGGDAQHPENAQMIAIAPAVLRKKPEVIIQLPKQY